VLLPRHAERQVGSSHNGAVRTLNNDEGRNSFRKYRQHKIISKLLCYGCDAVKFGTVKRLRWSRGCVLASSTQIRGFEPGRSRRIFQEEKIPSTPSFGGEVKPAVPCRRFTACKRTLNVAWKSAFRQNSRLHFLAH
jgi:hypothetical protein